MLLNIPEERRSHLCLGENLESAPKSQEYVGVYLLSTYVFIEWCLMKRMDSFMYRI